MPARIITSGCSTRCSTAADGAVIPDARQPGELQCAGADRRGGEFAALKDSGKTISDTVRTPVLRTVC